MGLIFRLIILCCAGLFATLAHAGLSPGDHKITLRIGDHQRLALVHIPPRAAGKPPLPLIFNFHGAGGRAAAQRDYTNMNALADTAGFAVAYPDGSGGFLGRFHTWNAGPCCGAAKKDNVDDVTFVSALIDRLVMQVPVDAARVYATGLSNGAMLTYRLAAALPGKIAAIAPIAGIIAPPSDPPGKQPVPIMHMHSENDPRALYKGGLGPRFPFTNIRTRHVAVDATLAEWAARNGCSAKPPVLQKTKRWQAPDGSRRTAARLAYQGCPKNGQVVLWRLTGAGHVWPGAKPYLTRVLGPATQVIDANKTIWRFFNPQHR